MYVCRECQQPINQASELCPYCGADLTQPAPGEKAKPASRQSPARLLLYFAIVIAGVWAVVWYSLPFPRQNPARQAEGQALEALRDLRSALASYAAIEGTFPETLEALGDQARAALQLAAGAHYFLQYSPGQAGSDGNVHSFSLLARPQFYGYRNFYTDQSGVIRATRENRPATPQDSPF